jgi:hypothetical protein
MKRRRFVATLGAGMVMLALVPAHADRLFTATLNGAQNVPFIRGIRATGSATLFLNAVETQVTYHIEYMDLDGVEFAAHFHNATPVQTGPIVFTLPPGNPKDGVWNLTPEDVAELGAGRIYVNIHTDLYPSGEIRGNLMEEALPVEETTWGRVKALFAAK